ncbi:pantoate--beta-alanine ligase [Verrucomicrobia bacterium SCGC AG-212-E04]|nr:pantoate--beta-alanine ligase [Verrucomicrobia bacterium SCGC AG-212-E04]
MGALHAGHLSLIALARSKAGPRGLVVASIFVNPLQFGPQEDLGCYPRPLADDLAKCRAAGANLVFHPTAKQMYPEAPSVTVDESKLAIGLCGAARPGHFRGVCTVVTKLFHLIRPDFAIFGQKDYQQLAIIRRMVRELNFPVTIVAGPTHRERDGLAMSSRNAYLKPEQRQEAPGLRKALLAGAQLIRSGETRVAKIELALRKAFRASAPSGRLDYLTVVDADNLQRPRHASGRIALVGAVFFGTTRLIDNEVVTVPNS